MSRYRSLWGTLLILGLLAADAAIVMMLADRLAAAHWLAAASFYAAAGIVWVLPAAAITRWIVSGARSDPAGSSGQRSGRFP